MKSLFNPRVWIILCNLLQIVFCGCNQQTNFDVSRKWRESANSDRGDEGYYFVGNSFRSLNCFSFHQCSLFCVKDSRCKSFNYLSDVGKCELNLEDRSAFLEAESTWVFFDNQWLLQEQGFVQRKSSAYCNRECFENNLPEILTISCDPKCNPDEICTLSMPHGDTTCLKTKFEITDFLLPWSEWSYWSPCSATCGNAVQTRTRSCGPPAQPWMCQGSDTEKVICELNLKCPHWSGWGEWSTCSTQAICGEGFKRRKRSCIPNTLNPSVCPGSEHQNVTCQAPSCTTPLKLTNGNYGHVLVYDDSVPFSPQWTGVCKDLISDEDLHEVLNKVCKQLGMYMDHPDNADDSSIIETIYLKVRNCSKEEPFLVQCNHEKWQSYQDCAELLQVQCTGEKQVQNHFLAEVTWQYAYDFCEERYRQMCSAAEIFPYGNNTAIEFYTGDTWIPIRDSYNDWVQVGTDHPQLGNKHNSIWSAPPWGLSPDIEHWKGNYFCCLLD